MIYTFQEIHYCLCLPFLNDKILKGFNKGLSTGMILINLQKAFDTINHEILLGKLYAIGLSDKIIAWFEHLKLT